MPNIIKPFSAVIRKNDLDVDARPLQLLDTIHRTALMSVLRGRVGDGASHFYDPTGQAQYRGFGKDGLHYEAGVAGRTWWPQEAIDDFSDRVTDGLRWETVGANPDLQEGGVDSVTDGPFGLRLHCLYGGPAVEVFDRKGKMVSNGGNKVALSGRVTCRGVPDGGGLENGIFFGVQLQGSDVDYLFVGFENTGVRLFSIVFGQVVAGVPTVTGVSALPVGTTEVTLALEVDFAGGNYQGFYSLVPNDEDYTGINWNAIAPPTLLPGGFNAPVVPRVHASFPAAYIGGERHSLSDLRVEANSDPFDGQQQASWYLEPLDGSNPLELSGIRQDSPDEILCVWERDAQGQGVVYLSLLDMDVPASPKLWRRWKDLGVWRDWDREMFPFWSPCWMDATEGHIVMTRNTRAQVSGVATDAKGEIWVVSLRWDKVFVFAVDGVGTLVSLYDNVTGRILRETGSWGARQFVSQETYQPLGNYEAKNRDFTAFSGTLAKVSGGSEAVQPSVTYGCSIQRASDGLVYLAYGVRSVPLSYGGEGKGFAGVVCLTEGAMPAYPRWLFRKDDVGYPLWERSDEAWTVCGMTRDKALYWLQAGSSGPKDTMEGVLCRRDFAGDASDNLSTSSYAEDTSWGRNENDLFYGKGLSLFVQDSDPQGSEVVIVGSGWMGGSHVTVLWYNSISPALSKRRTYSGGVTVDPVSDNLTSYPIGNIFPTWLLYRFSEVGSDLADCRISRSAGQGADSFVSRAEGAWLAYARFLGVGARTLRHDILRGPAIERDDFVLEVRARWVPPFAAGYRFNAHQSMNINQRADFSLGVEGEKGTRARVGFRLKGLVGGGGVFGFAESEYVNSGGLVSQSQEVGYPLAEFPVGGEIRLRIVRQGVQWSLLFWVPSSNSFATLLTFAGYQVPLLGCLSLSVQDAFGVESSLGFEVYRFILAPQDDPRGKVWSSKATFQTLPQRLGSAQGGAVVREAFPLDGDGSLVLADGWLYAGLMPSP